MADIELLNDDIQAQPATRQGLGLGSIVLLAGIVLTAAVFGIALMRQNQVQPTSGPAPDFTLTTLDGEQIRLADLKGQVVVVNFWASWCGPCRDEAPVLQDAWEKYQDQGVVFLGIAWTDTERGARAYLEEFGVTYPNGLDLGTKISEYYHIQGIPETFIINRKGEITDFFMVQLSEQRLTETLERVLATGT